MAELSRVPEGKGALMLSKQVCASQGTEQAGEEWRVYLTLGGE